MSKSIDELIILNISKDNNHNYDQFLSDIKPLIKKSFMPVSIEEDNRLCGGKNILTMELTK